MHAYHCYRIFWTDETCAIEGVKRPGIPFVLDQNMESVEGINNYLFDQCTNGGLRSRESRSKAVRILVEFEKFANKHGFDWKEGRRHHIYLFRDELLEDEKRKKQPEAINDYTSRVCARYMWALEKRLIPGLPFRYKTMATRPWGEFGPREIRVNEFALRTSDKPTVFLRREQVPLFYRELEDETQRLMTRLGVQVGLRRREITYMTVGVLPDPREQSGKKMISVSLDPRITKGNRPRTVQFTPRLARDLWDYKNKVRVARAERYRRRHSHDSDLLFLSEAGDPLPINYLNKALKKASRRVGYRVTPHMLRHTYATYEFLRMMKELSQLQALEWVRDRLGHKSIATTERYIHSSMLVSVENMVGYQHHIDDIITGEGAAV